MARVAAQGRDTAPVPKPEPIVIKKRPHRARRDKLWLPSCRGGWVWQDTSRTNAYTGLRWGEVTGLRTQHLDLLKRTLTVTEAASEVGDSINRVEPKTEASRRSVALPRFLYSELVGYPRPKKRPKPLRCKGFVWWAILDLNQ